MAIELIIFDEKLENHVYFDEFFHRVYSLKNITVFGDDITQDLWLLIDGFHIADQLDSLIITK